MNFHHKPSAVAICGKKGTGKTTLYLKLLKAHKAKWKFVFDPNREVSIKLKLPVCESLEECAKAAIAREVVVYDPSAMFTADEFPAALSLFCRFVYAFSCKVNGTKLLAVDEIQKFTKTTMGGVPKSLVEIMDTGRREEIDCLFIVNKGLNKLSNDIRDQLTTLHVFQTTGKTSLKWLEEDFSEEEIAAIRKQEIGKFLTAEV